MRIMYLRNKNGLPEACVAMLFDKQQNKVLYALSVYNQDDEFNRAVARTVAEERLNQSPVVLSLQDKEATAHNISTVVVQDISKSKFGTYPRKARELARRWIKKNLRNT